MVKLNFRVLVGADLEAVWGYFSRFQNVPQWDPNTRGCEIRRKQPAEVGSIYDIVTVFNEKESNVLYTTRHYNKGVEECSIGLFGENETITAEDEIICRRKGASTEVEYRADICLKGLAVLATPLIYFSLQKICEQSRVGLRDKARQLWKNAQ